jgi:hypothetical protein
MFLKFKFAVPLLMTILGAAAMPAFGQAGGGGGGGGQGGGGGGRGQWNPQAMMDRLKTDLGATDDEFAAIQPKIEKVQQLQREAMGGGRGFGGGRGNRGGGQGGQGGNNQAAATPTTPVATAAADLRKTLDDKDAKPEDIKAKLDALRAAKKTAKEDLVKAQDDLKSVLTQRQEAVLVERGMLE